MRKIHLNFSANLPNGEDHSGLDPEDMAEVIKILVKPELDALHAAIQKTATFIFSGRDLKSDPG